jgi:hypothetical protein
MLIIFNRLLDLFVGFTASQLHSTPLQTFLPTSSSSFFATAPLPSAPTLLEGSGSVVEALPLSSKGVSSFIRRSPPHTTVKDNFEQWRTQHYTDEHHTLLDSEWGHMLRVAASEGDLHRVRRLHERGGSHATHINDADANGWQVS